MAMFRVKKEGAEKIKSFFHFHFFPFSLGSHTFKRQQFIRFSFVGEVQKELFSVILFYSTQPIQSSRRRFKLKWDTI